MSVGTPDLLLDETEIGAVDLVSDEISARSPWELFSRRFREDKFALAGLIFLALLILVAIFAPLVCKLVGAPGPYFADQNALDVFGQPTGPSSAHIFGVDQLGRDVFSRVIYGARVSLLVAFVSTFLTTIFGVACGLFAGFYRGWIDTLISRTIDAWLAIPYLLLAIGLASACSFGTGCLGGLITKAPLTTAANQRGYQLDIRLGSQQEGLSQDRWSQTRASVRSDEAALTIGLDDPRAPRARSVDTCFATAEQVPRFRGERGPGRAARTTRCANERRTHDRLVDTRPCPMRNLRLTDPLRKGPAPAGLFYCPGRSVLTGMARTASSSDLHRLAGSLHPPAVRRASHQLLNAHRTDERRRAKKQPLRASGVRQRGAGARP